MAALAGTAAGAWGWAQFGAPVRAVNSRDDGRDGSGHSRGDELESGLASGDFQRRFAYRSGRRRGSVRAVDVRSVKDVTLRLLPGGEGALQPFFAPDGREIAFFADQQLKVISIDGGPARVVCAVASPRGGSWGDDNVIVFADGPQSGLSRVAASGGTPEPLTTIGAGEASHRFPHVLPGAVGVAFTIQRADGGYSIGVVPARARQHSVVVDGAHSPSFAGGRLFYVNDHSEWAAVPFDLAALRVRARLRSVRAQHRWSDLGDSGLSVSRDGTLVDLPYEASLKSMGVIDRTGHFTELPGPPRDFLTPRLSRDGQRVVVNVGGAGPWGDIWTGDLSGSLVAADT